jgi:hypothetical protein
MFAIKWPDEYEGSQEEEEFGGLEGQNMIGNQVADGPGDDFSEDDDDDDDDWWMKFQE